MDPKGVSEIFISNFSSRRDEMLVRLRTFAALSRTFATAAGPPPTTAVRKGHEIDVSKVLPLLREAGGISAAEAAALPELKQFGGRGRTFMAGPLFRQWIPRGSARFSSQTFHLVGTKCWLGSYFSQYSAY
jgi:hypothetical protein